MTITNSGTNQQRRLEADDSGQFVVNFLPVGTYDVLVEKEGFASNLRKGTELQINTTMQLSLDRVELVQATSTTLVQDLPLDGRNVLQLMTLNAGVSTEAAGGGTNMIQNVNGAVTPSINGSRGKWNQFSSGQWRP